jgi:hypothetical protein
VTGGASGSLWQIAAGLMLAAAGWRLPRLVAGTRGAGWAALLDAAPLASVALGLAAASGRPIFAGAAALALGAGFAFADRTMRETLREPVTFVALSELPQLFTHPHLYLPFAGTGLVLGGAGAAVLAAAGILVAEPAALAPHPLAALAADGFVVLLCGWVARNPGHAARGLRWLGPSGEPFADAARLGPVAMLIVHGVIARAERPSRQARLAPAVLRAPSTSARPLILVQCESFFDARRALPLPPGLLSGYDACCETYGRLDVPAWGANSTRAEFAVLSGIEETALGYDRFNPYHALTRAPIASQVWRLRQAGYRTVCLHPFDRRFYRRDLAMPALGFERFLGRETIGGSRTPPYLPDPELAHHILRVLDAEGPRCFIFAITMGNHGPWTGKGGPIDPALADLVDPDMPQRAELLRYLDGLRRTDEMLQILIDGLERRRPEAILACYGDHLPSLPRAFAHLGWDANSSPEHWRSDYAIRAGLGGAARRRDLAAHELGRLVADLALAPRGTDILDSVVGERRRA